jgi:signal transduction histidine kinase
MARNEGCASITRHWRHTGLAFRVGAAEERKVALLFTNITERKQAEDALRQLNEKLEERVQERTEQVRSLVTELTLSEQSERRRIAGILHDDLQQLR